MAGAKGKYKLEWADFDREPVNGLVEGPVWNDVRAIVEHLAGGRSGFVVLSRGEDSFIQTARAADGLIVEFHDPEDGLYTLADGPAPAAEAVALFRAWFDDPRSVAEHGDWERAKV